MCSMMCPKVFAGYDDDMNMMMMMMMMLLLLMRMMVISNFCLGGIWDAFVYFR